MDAFVVLGFIAATALSAAYLVGYATVLCRRRRRMRMAKRSSNIWEEQE